MWGNSCCAVLLMFLFLGLFSRVLLPPVLRDFLILRHVEHVLDRDNPTRSGVFEGFTTDS